VVIAEEGDVLLDLVFEDLEVTLVQPGHQAVVRVSHGNRQRDQIRSFYNGFLVVLAILVAYLRPYLLYRRLFPLSRRSRSRLRFLFLNGPPSVRRLSAG